MSSVDSWASTLTEDLMIGGNAAAEIDHAVQVIQAAPKFVNGRLTMSLLVVFGNMAMVWLATIFLWATYDGAIPTLLGVVLGFVAMPGLLVAAGLVLWTSHHRAEAVKRTVSENLRHHFGMV